MHGIWSTVERSSAYTRLQKEKSRVKRTKGYRAAASAGTTAHAKIKDIHEQYDESQNPYVMMVRDTGDALFSETEHGAAIRAIRKILPDFWPEDFGEELEKTIVPVAVDAFLKGDLVFLNELCDEAARKYCQAQMKARKNLKTRPDDRILWVNPPILVKVEINNRTPILIVGASIEQVDCDYDDNDNVVRGGPN